MARVLLEDGVCGPFMVLVPHNEEAGFAHSQLWYRPDRCFLGRCWHCVVMPGARCKHKPPGLSMVGMLTLHARGTVEAQSHLGSAW